MAEARSPTPRRILLRRQPAVSRQGIEPTLFQSIALNVTAEGPNIQLCSGYSMDFFFSETKTEFVIHIEPATAKA